MSATTMRAPETVRRPPPLLKDFFDCFVAGTGQDVRTAMTLERNLPPLNPLQYSRLVPPTSLASFARAVGLPNELQLFNKNNVTNEKEAWAVQHPMKLAIRATRQRPPPRPVRRGARVMVRVAGVDHDVGAPLKRPRDTTAVGSSILPGEELQSEEKQRRSKRQKEEEEEERDSAGEDEVESDFMMQDDDDDYDNDLASDGGDGDDFYM
ncbi:hypothetical protein AGDE_14457 [Angomonas deanei]|nr:hypothetical protein AGDE_14457 [Angomonas deanei]|eukprot:EPY20829.1 hypothetical protein AGDE_14457 [Angomonas deanei]